MGTHIDLCVFLTLFQTIKDENATLVISKIGETLLNRSL